MQQPILYYVLLVFISLVWFVNGIWCKVLRRVPRHEQIVARVLGAAYAGQITRTIGALEVCMALWVLSGIWPLFCAVTQALVVVAMNVLEYFLARDLLLFGRANAVNAALFILVVLGNAWLGGHFG